MNELKDIFRNGTSIALAKGEKIKAKQNVIYIEEGFVGLYLKDKQKNRSLLIIYAQDEVINLLPKDSDLYAFIELELISLTTTKIKKMPQKKFISKVANNPEYSKYLLKSFAELYLHALARIGNLENLSVARRLTNRLLFFAKRFGINDGERTVITVPLTHSDIAQSIGTTRETVNRMIKQLEKQNILEMKNQTITISSTEKLYKFTR